MTRTVRGNPYADDPTASGGRGNLPVSVSALVRSAKDVLEHRFQSLWVTGEMSNITLARSGHWYFVLKDAEAQVRCVMFRGRNQYLDWTPREGMRVEVRATVTLYEARGEFQLIADAMRRAGRGELYEAFLRLRDALQAEGLFEPALKRPLPAHPRCIGIVTSPKAAALRDIVSTLRRRNPALPIILYPAAVQGAQAAQGLIEAIERAGRRGECDVLILARGGGGIEDLWCFNDERLARAVRACPIPIVTGVGHETDFTIADFVADLRAPTPTAAAELVAPRAADLYAHLAALLARLSRQIARRLEVNMQALDYLQRRLIDPRRLIGEQRLMLGGWVKRLARAASAAVARERLAFYHASRRLLVLAPDIPALSGEARVLALRMNAALHAELERRAIRLVHLVDALRHLDPAAVLGRGYSITRDAHDRIITDAATITLGASIRVTLARGGLLASVTAKETDPAPGEAPRGSAD